MAVENGVQNAELGYLLFPFEQYSNLAGKPLVGGHMEIYEAGTDTKYISYQNWDGAENPFRIPIPNDGRITVLADPTKTFDCYLYDSYNNLVCSRLNVQANVPGNISIKGADTILKNTDGTLDIYLRTLGNNVREYTVNTHNKVLDVQEPLYFVENSNTATIIGFSGDNYAQKDYVDSAVSGKLDTTAFSTVSGDFLTDKFEYDDNFNITGYDGSAFASNGETYSAGTNIDITDNVISVTGLPTSSDVENAISSAVTNVENKFEYNENNYITAYNNSAFAGTNYSAGDYVSIENDTISVTGLQPSGDYATKDYVESATSGKQDTLSAGDGISIVNNTISVTSQGGGIEQVSHDDTLSGNGNSEPLGIANIEDFVKQNDLTAYQEKGDYYSASNPSGFITNDALTGLQPSGDYATHDDLTAYQTIEGMTAYQPSGNYADITALDGKVDTSSFTAFSSTTNEKIEYISGALSGTYELSAGEGIDITDYPNEQKTVISVTAQGGNPEVENLVTAQSATWNSVTGKADTTALNDYATTSQLANKLDTTAFSTVSGDFLTAHQDISNLMPKSESANFYPMTGNPSGFLTGVDLTPYQTIAGMTAYQPVGDYASATDLANYQPVSSMTAYQEAGDYYSASNPSGFITSIPDTYLQNTDLEISDNKITGISGIPLSAGGSEIPTAVSSYWQSASDTVCANSGVWGGSALPISAGPGIKFELVNDTLVASTDETVLFFAGNDSSGYQNGNLTESIKNFERIRVAGMDNDGHVDVKYIYPAWTKDADNLNNATNYEVLMYGALPYPPQNTVWEKWSRYSFSALTSFNIVIGYEGSYTANSVSNVTNAHKTSIREVVGINRISGGN